MVKKTSLTAEWFDVLTTRLPFTGRMMVHLYVLEHVGDWAQQTAGSLCIGPSRDVAPESLLMWIRVNKLTRAFIIVLLDIYFRIAANSRKFYANV